MAAGAEPAEEDRGAGEVSPRDAPAPGEPSFDPASLPPIEEITAATDIRGFLRPGVPSELTRAALRRAWASDPKIRNFVGLADYAWDFNAADSMSGFGPLQAIDQAAQMAARIVAPDRPAAETGNILDPASATPKVARIPAESTYDVDHRAAAETDDHAKPSRDEPMNKIGPPPHTDELVHHQHGDIAAQYTTSNPDKPKSSLKRQHGSALPK